MPCCDPCVWLSELTAALHFQVEKARQASHFHKDSITRAIKAGVKIAVGTESPSDPLGN